MVVVAVKRLGDEDQNGDTRHRVSLLSLRSSYAIQHFDLPFRKDTPVDSMSCRGLLYFNDENCHSAVCNLRTRQLKRLPPPYVPSPTPTTMPMANGFGLGYDANTHDYKAFRSFSIRTESGRPSKTHTHLYSLNNDCWKSIPTPDAQIFPENKNAVYVDETGCCYWQAILGKKFGVPPEEPYGVLSFNFATEEFGHIRLPPVCNDEYTYCLVKCGDSLGAVTYMRPPDIPRDVSAFAAAQAPTFTVFKRVGENWKIFREITVSSDILRPLGMIGDGYLFVEVKCSLVHTGQLALYDLNSAKLKLKRFSVYSLVKQMRVFPSCGSNQELMDAGYYS